MAIFDSLTTTDLPVILEEPLLPPKQPKSNGKTIANTMSSLWLGFVTGLFIQMSTLGAHALSLSLLGPAVVQRYCGVLGWIWSTVLCLAGLSLLWAVLALLNNNDERSRIRRNVLEARFLAGAIASLTTSCVMLSLLLKEGFRWPMGLMGMVMVAVLLKAPAPQKDDDDEATKDDHGPTVTNDFDVEQPDEYLI